MEIIGWLFVLGLLAKLGTTSLLAFAVGALAFGSLWFWIILAAATASVFAFIEHDDGIGATGSLVAFFLLIQLFGDARPFTFIIHHPVDIALWGVGYFFAGTLWCIAKWWFHCQAQREKYDEALRKQKKDIYKILPEKPSAAESKEMILRWMSFWPWSMVWTIINDPIKKAFRAIYRKIQNHLQRIADKAWEGIKEEK